MVKTKLILLVTVLLSELLPAQTEYKKFFDADGKLQEEGNIMDNQKHGEWKYYTIEGKLETVEKYENGNLVK